MSDAAYIQSREQYHPELDIPLSIKKAYEDYWATEEGWKHKKAKKAKALNWKSTFNNALTLPSNQVKKTRGTIPSTQSGEKTEMQLRFAEFLRQNAPLMLNMPLQPTKEEADDLHNMSKSMLLDIVHKINNDKFLTDRRNSVYQTIMELKKKEYG